MATVRGASERFAGFSWPTSCFVSCQPPHTLFMHCPDCGRRRPSCDASLASCGVRVTAGSDALSGVLPSCWPRNVAGARESAASSRRGNTACGRCQPPRQPDTSAVAPSVRICAILRAQGHKGWSPPFSGSSGGVLCVAPMPFAASEHGPWRGAGSVPLIMLPHTMARTVPQRVYKSAYR